jgi:hypothetical protein
MAMKGHAEFPELDHAIDAHARAIVAGDLSAARAFLSSSAESSAKEAHDAFVSKIARDSIKEFVKLGRARIGMQHMSKIRFLTGDEPLLMVNRWREENGAWHIAESEDLSGKRSAWSDIEIPAALRRGANHHA